MADVHDKKTRSYNMSKIGPKNTKPEILVRKYLHMHGFRYRLHVKDLPGKPDIVLPRYKVIIFVNGCFWHGHGDCHYASVPKTRTEWWTDKINKTKIRDSHKVKLLESAGWRVVTIWECSLKPLNIESTLADLVNQITNQKP